MVGLMASWQEEPQVRRKAMMDRFDTLEHGIDKLVKQRDRAVLAAFVLGWVLVADMLLRPPL